MEPRVSVNQLNLFEFISWQIGTLKFLGIWLYMPCSVHIVHFLLAVFSRTITGALVFTVPAAGQMIYLSRLIYSGRAELQEAAGIINLILTELLVTIKLLYLCLRRVEVTKLMDQIIGKEFYNFSIAHIKSVKVSIKLSRWLFICLFVSCGLDIAIHMVVAPGIRGFETLPVKMDLIYIDVNDDVYFKYIFAYQILYKPIILITFVALKTLPWSCIIFATNQLDNLLHTIKNMKFSVKQIKNENNCDENEAFKKVFKNCVRHHEHILRFVETLQTAFGGQFSLTLIFNACIICTTSVQFFSIQYPSKNIIELSWVFAYMFIFVVILFLDCYYGDTITRKNLNLSKAIYAYTWMDLSSTQKRNVLMFIGKTQNPLIINSSVLVPVSLETFTKVMNWTYKGFAVLNQMKT